MKKNKCVFLDEKDTFGTLSSLNIVSYAVSHKHAEGEIKLLRWKHAKCFNLDIFVSFLR